MTQVLNNQPINNQRGTTMNNQELINAVAALKALVQTDNNAYVELIKGAYDANVKPLIQTSNVAGTVKIQGLDFAVNTDGDVVLKKEELENLFNAVLSANQQQAAVQQPVVNAQPLVNTVQPTSMTAEQQARTKVLVDQMAITEARIRNLVALGMSYDYDLSMYNRYKSELDSIMGNGLVNMTINTAQTVANNVSNYTANTVAPVVGNAGNDVVDFLTGLLKGATQLGKDVWNEVAPVTTAGVNAGFNIADKSITFTGKQLGNGINTVQNQIVNISQLGRI